MTPKKRPAPKRGSLEERQAVRRRLGSLGDLAIKPQTKVKYQEALHWAFGHLRLSNRELPADVLDFDSLVAELIELAWEEGESLSLIGNLLSALTSPVTGIPALRGNLQHSWKLFGVWGRHEMPCRAWPLTVLQLLALSAWLTANHAQDCAILCLIGFHGLLRSGELLSLRCSQFSFSSVRARGQLSLGVTKTSQRSGNPEGVSITWPFLVDILRRAFHRLGAEDLILRRPQCEFRRLFDAAVADLGFQGHFKPYSLRRGGATRHFLEFGEFDRTTERGRWQNIRTARLYIDTARADQAGQNQSPQVHARLLALTRHLPASAFQAFQE